MWVATAAYEPRRLRRMAAPLEGIRIVDFTRYQQGPFAGVMLADMGAEIVKVEDLAGDYGRRMFREPDGFSGFWEALNRGKRSVCIDLRQGAGRDLALMLIERADVLLENFRPGTMEKFGLGYEAVAQRNPRLIYGQATGWGTKGPLAGYPSFDQIAQAYSGYAQHSGGGPGKRPEVAYPGVADQTGGMNLAFGIMTALFARERTGRGQKVEVSLLGTQLALQSPNIMMALKLGYERERDFRASPTVGHYECADGRWVMIVGIDQKFWPRIAKALGLEQLTEDERFARPYQRFLNREALQAELEGAFRGGDSKHWLGRLRECDVPSSVVHGHLELGDDEQVRANGYIVEQEHPRFGLTKAVGPHVQLQDTKPVVGAAAPELGKHTLAVLRELGLGDEEVRQLAEAKVIAGPGL